MDHFSLKDHFCLAFQSLSDLFKLFIISYMKVNIDKSHFLMSGNKKLSLILTVTVSGYQLSSYQL